MKFVRNAFSISPGGLIFIVKSAIITLKPIATTKVKKSNTKSLSCFRIKKIKSQISIKIGARASLPATRSSGARTRKARDRKVGFKPKRRSCPLPLR